MERKKSFLQQFLRLEMALWTSVTNHYHDDDDDGLSNAHDIDGDDGGDGEGEDDGERLEGILWTFFEILWLISASLPSSGKVDWPSS